jgi:hypothetical protein
MRKLDLILENIRDEYMINLLEEGATTELQTLKTKKFLNENLNRVRAMLIEEGVMQGVQQHLANNWGKYLAGAGALGAGYAANEYGNVGDVIEQGKAQIAEYQGENPASNAIGTVAGGIGQVASNTADGLGDAASTAADNIGDAASDAVRELKQRYGQLTGDQTMITQNATPEDLVNAGPFAR